LVYWKDGKRCTSYLKKVGRGEKEEWVKKGKEE
jgi:hypothetical protein